MIASRASSFAIATIGSLVVLAPVRCDAQWWRSAPVDFKSCADVAEKAKTKEEKTAKLAECNAKFAGRRKPGGGYTYYDFMQDRTFDIAGPNPTPEEQKKIDEQYTAYLERERRSNIAAALAAKQQQPEPPPTLGWQQVSLRTEQTPPPPAETEKVPVPVASPVKQAARIRAAQCAKDQFSCEWPRLSEKVNELKKLFNPQQQQQQQRPSRRRARLSSLPSAHLRTDAGTHSHRMQLRQMMSAILPLSIDHAVWVPASAGATCAPGRDRRSGEPCSRRRHQPQCARGFLTRRGLTTGATAAR